MSISDKLSYLANTKEQIRQALISKGVPVATSDTFRSYAAKILLIEDGGGGPVVNTFDITVPSGTVGSDLTDFPVMIDLNDMPDAFWLTVRPDGGNVRAYANDGTTLIPHDLTYINTVTRRGRMFVKHSLTATSDTTFKVKVLSATETVLPNGDSNGRNAVWSDYEVVWQFPSKDNRTGNPYTQVMNLVPFSLWKQVQYYEFAGNPHQGITAEASGRVITIDTNYLRCYDSSNLSSILASNSNPCGDIQTVTGGVTDHMCDGTVIEGELFAVCNNYPALRPSQEHLTVFDADTLALKRTYDISGLAGEQVSSCCLNPDDGLLYCSNYETGSKIHVFSQTGVFQSSIPLSRAIRYAQGIEYVDGKLYISQGTSGHPIWEVELDGTVNGVIYNRPTFGINEGISYDGTSLWVLDGDGDVLRLEKIPEKEDWSKIHFDVAAATIPTLSTEWTMAASVLWTDMGADLQQGFLSAANGSDKNNRATVAYYRSSGRVSMWNSTDSWAVGNYKPVEGMAFRIGASQDGTTERKLWIDGAVSLSDSSISARPVGGTSMDFVVNASTKNKYEDGESYYQHVWFRSEVMSNDWMAADSENMNNPSGFYTITTVI